MPVCRSVLGCLAAALLAGCGAPPADAPALTVTVTLDGKPAGNLGVVLVAEGGAADTAGGFGGTTDGTGRATLYGPTPGAAPPGKYKVVVNDRGPETDEPVAKKPANRVPAIFAKPTTTTLSLTVEAGKSEYQIEVKSKG